MKARHLFTRAPVLGPLSVRCFLGARYLALREPRFRHEVAAGCTLHTPATWAGVPETRGAEFFGYYDKTPWSPDGERFVVHHYTGGQEVEILVYDHAERQTVLIGTTRAWNWQQGAMVQWLPSDMEHEIVYNAVDGRQLGARFESLDGRRHHWLPWPVQAVHPSGSEYLSLNYLRLAVDRPDYGYTVRADNWGANQVRDGIWQVNTLTGDADLVVPIADLACQDATHHMRHARHWVNHCLYSPTGSSFVFLHRWRKPPSRSWSSRLYMYNGSADGPTLLLDESLISHYWWIDDSRILVWASCDGTAPCYLSIDVANGRAAPFAPGELGQYGDGHPSLSPDGGWLLTDSYPDLRGQQRLILHEVATHRTHTVGRFLHPPWYWGSRRCDLHPRWSPDGDSVSFDSVYSGRRRSYILHVSDWLAGAPECGGHDGGAM